MPYIAAPSPRRARSSNLSARSVTLPQRFASPSPAQTFARRLPLCLDNPGSNSELPQSPLSARNSIPPSRLSSPIALQDIPYMSLHSKSPTPCNAPLKRRTTPRPSRSARRRLHLPRIDCPLDPFRRAAVFDQLSWIPALDAPPCVEHDIADLSQIPLKEDFSHSAHSVPATGPVRRRKTSMRSNSLASTPSNPTDVSILPLLPLHPSACPTTPPPRNSFDPSRVTFQNLMPVFPHGASPDMSTYDTS
ncbi:hypothetical protein F5J12DRAFT_387604 [Pisolithus orientalis]|uniref:uncharacterized protein n=1 Tax=Pisolithus orientalis TaxID=936130 RepID=UPI0022250906|nr:uncharacterized protein F5J12DRAFT_387604 [Pisolithus orientalis]KAI6028625.1 hypothetical protein F5J12DRAFT_387604 [Pisolithus orientalis]